MLLTVDRNMPTKQSYNIKHFKHLNQYILKIVCFSFKLFAYLIQDFFCQITIDSNL